MRLKNVVLLGVLGCLGALMLRSGRSEAQTVSERLVRIAEIEVDPQQIDVYKAALREGIAAAVRLEPGVLSLYAVSVKGHPEQVRVMEVYANQAAYEAHLQTPHFKKYKATTQGMVRWLELIETDPILLGSK